jgi:hypothetical protein
MKRVMLAAVVLGIGSGIAGRAGAEMVVTFTYSGVGAEDSGYGGGSFSFADGLTTVGLADLTSFDFVLHDDATGAGTSSEYSFGLGDLTSFSAALSAGPTLASLSLGTGFVDGSNPAFSPQSFTVASLAPDGASTSSILVLPPPEAPIISLATTGSLTVAGITTGPAAPEPASLAMGVVASLVGLGIVRRRRVGRSGPHPSDQGGFARSHSSE